MHGFYKNNAWNNNPYIFILLYFEKIKKLYFCENKEINQCILPILDSLFQNGTKLAIEIS